MSTSSTNPAPSLQRLGGRNLSIECCKLVASFFVVFIHFRFPGDFGQFVDCLARFAVPLFFAFTGYFNYRAKSDKVKLRTWYILKLNIIAIALDLFWKCLQVEFENGSTIVFLRESMLSVDHIRHWMLVNLHPFRVHLWYLTAVLEVYVVYWLYVRFYEDREINYRPLYFVGAGLMAINLSASVFSLSVFVFQPVQLYYNALFYGLPMFALGVFIREHQERILKNYRITVPKLIFLILVGILHSYIEWAGLGKHLSDIYIGALIQVVALLLLCARHPNAAGKSRIAASVISRFGFYSTVIYVIHFIMAEVYMMLGQAGVAGCIGSKTEAFLRPIIIAVLSLLAAVVWERILHAAKCLAKKKTA